MRFEDLAKEEGARVQEPEKVGAGETFLNRAVGMLPAGNRVVDAISTAALEGSRTAGKLAPGLSRSLASLPVVGQFAPVAEPGVKLTPQAQAELARMGIPEEKPAPEPGLVDTYRQMRDTRAERTEAGSKQNPWAGRAGALTGFGLSLLAPLPKVGTGLKGAVATGAGYGALQGLTEGKADLTRGELGQAAKDTLVGGAFGAGAGAVGYGLQKLGERGVRALRNAREDTLAQETERLGSEAQAAQTAAAKEAEAARKEVGQAREMNKAYDAKAAARAEREAAALERRHGQALEMDRGREAKLAASEARGAQQAERAGAKSAAQSEKEADRAAREADRFAAQRTQADRLKQGEMRAQSAVDRAKRVLGRARGRPGGPSAAPPEDPSTKVLEGYLGKAEERRAVNYDRVRQRQADINNPDLPTNAASENQAYIDKYGHAVNDPARFRREFIERYLRENHGDEVAERLMRERVSQEGQILPRPTPPPQETTGVQDAGDWARRGQYERAGGGGSAWQGYGSEGKTIAALPEDLPGAGALTGQPVRKPGNMAYDVGGQRGPEFSKQVTAGGPGPSLAEEAEAAMAARRAAAAGANVGRGAALPTGQPRQEILPPREVTPAGSRPADAPAMRERANDGHGGWIPGAQGPRIQDEPIFTAQPIRRPGASPFALDVRGRRGVLNMEPTRALPPAPPPAAVPTLHGGEGAMPPVGPTGQAPPINEVQDVTRLAGPADIGPLAAERAAQREQHAMGAVVRGGYEGVRSGNNVMGAVLGGLAGLRREALRDPAVKARVLSAAKVHLLAQVSPEVFARVGGPLARAATSGDGRYQTMRYVYARKDPEFRKAEAEAAAKASHLTDEQLMDLISGAAPQ